MLTIFFQQAPTAGTGRFEGTAGRWLSSRTGGAVAASFVIAFFSVRLEQDDT